MSGPTKETTALANADDAALCMAIAECLFAEACFRGCSEEFFSSEAAQEIAYVGLLKEVDPRMSITREKLGTVIEARLDATTGQRTPATFPGPLGLSALIGFIHADMWDTASNVYTHILSSAGENALKLADITAAHMADTLADETSPGWRKPGAVHPGAPETKEG